MAVRIVTDSVSDLPPELAEALGVSVVPLILRFGDEEYYDGRDLTPDEFYAKLRSDLRFPKTAGATPGMFAGVYDGIAGEADAILVITLSSSLSTTYQAALDGRNLMRSECRVEVLDSRVAAMPEGFTVLRAARAAAGGAPLDAVLDIARDTAARSELFCTFETLEYLRRGGRIGAAQALLGSLLNVKPLLVLADGVVKPAGRVRTRKQAVDRLVRFAASYSNIDELGVEYTVCREEAEDLMDRLSDLYPRDRIHLSGMTPVIGAHTGPGLLVVAVCGDRSGKA